MNNQKIEEIITQICDIVVEVLKINKKDLRLGTEIKKNFEDCNVFEIIIQIEALFNIDTKDDDVEEIKTLKDLIDYILKLLNIHPKLK